MSSVYSPMLRTALSLGLDACHLDEPAKQLGAEEVVDRMKVASV